MNAQTDTQEAQSHDRPEFQQSGQSVENEEIEGLETAGGSWGGYPIDEMLIRHETRTASEAVRRIDQKRYVMDPDFQRDFIWLEDKQSN